MLLFKVNIDWNILLRTRESPKEDRYILRYEKKNLISLYQFLIKKTNYTLKQEYQNPHQLTFFLERDKHVENQWTSNENLVKTFGKYMTEHLQYFRTYL